MTQSDNDGADPGKTSQTYTKTTVTPPPRPPIDIAADGEYTPTTTDTIAAVVIAVLAVVIILTLLLVFRALRKRQRARRGQQFGHNISTVATGVMSSGVGAYPTASSNVPVRGGISWESVNPSTSPSVTQSNNMRTNSTAADQRAGQNT